MLQQQLLQMVLDLLHLLLQMRQTLLMELLQSAGNVLQYTFRQLLQGAGNRYHGLTVSLCTHDSELQSRVYIDFRL